MEYQIKNIFIEKSCRKCAAGCFEPNALSDACNDVADEVSWEDDDGVWLVWLDSGFFYFLYSLDLIRSFCRRYMYFFGYTYFLHPFEAFLRSCFFSVHLFFSHNIFSSNPCFTEICLIVVYLSLILGWVDHNQKNEVIFNVTALKVQVEK